jgi:hypothetical protein
MGEGGGVEFGNGHVIALITPGAKFSTAKWKFMWKRLKVFA